ncbi:acyltransferase [Mucilaginibacter pallidiroseus]|uniref:Acyltransferase n=1 Tax=Mucilaginibacter pallidiroseus TaxID=2599295 RepID=A0A563U818_9SPHI|nr:acyltransferase [Mucilaginibacter pallidiroseus]TWR27439.1 acyltransferase [Mucilaginibacter pallidiroseus]
MPTTPALKQHLPQVDYVRAIASLAVALFHLGGKALPVLKYGWLGVQMFFVLSGFIICWAIPHGYTWRNAGTFIIKRLIRIEPPYVASIILILLLNRLFINDYTSPDWLNVAGHFAYINNFTGKPYLSPVYWTLGIEFQFYLFIALAFPVFNGRWGTWFVMGVWLLSCSIDVPGSTISGVFSFFALGMLYYRWYSQKTTGLLTTLLILPIFVYQCATGNWLPIAAGVLTLLILVLPLKQNRAVSFFARISFSLYLTHDAIGSRLVVLLGQNLPKTIVGKGIAFTSGIIVSIVFAYIFYLLIERPCMRLSKKASYNGVNVAHSVTYTLQ